jgi:lipopolysaccharide export system permease protein
MIIARYFIGAMLRGYVIVAMALIALFGLFAAMDEASDIGEAGYTAADALLFVTMTLPATLLDLAPFVILLGTIFGLAGFLRTQELLALRAAGLSAAGICGLALGAALIATCVIVPIELAARPLLQQAILFRTSEQSPDGNLLDREGSWIARDNTFVYVGSLIGGQRPSKISQFEFGDDLQLERFTHAREAEIAAPERWRFRDVEIRTVREDGHDREFLDTLDWQPIWYPAALLQEFPMASLTLTELRQHAEFLDQTAGSSAAHALEFWRRALAPISIFAFAFLGAALVTSVRPRSGGGLVIVIGIAVAIGLYLFQQIGVNAASRWGLPPFLAVGLPTVILILLALAAGRRANEGPH